MLCVYVGGHVCTRMCVPVFTRAGSMVCLPHPFLKVWAASGPRLRLGYVCEALLKTAGLAGGWRGGGSGLFPRGYKSKVSAAESELLFVSPLPAAACGLFHSLLSFKSS